MRLVSLYVRSDPAANGRDTYGSPRLAKRLDNEMVRDFFCGEPTRRIPPGHLLTLACARKGQPAIVVSSLGLFAAGIFARETRSAPGVSFERPVAPEQVRRPDNGVRWERSVRFRGGGAHFAHERPAAGKFATAPQAKGTGRLDVYSGGVLPQVCVTPRLL